MKLLNLGCGSRYHDSWTNIDFASSGGNVIEHNLLKGIPYSDNFFDVAYHSHVLEHFSKEDGGNFIIECFRVLKPNGVIRIAVPDLERIAQEYLKNLNLALQGNICAQSNYEWIKLELFDQTVRNESGGDMAKYIFQKNIPNEDYVYERLGEEARSLRRAYLEQLNTSQNAASNEVAMANKQASPIYKDIKRNLKKIFFKKKIDVEKEISIGRFRLGGEVHQWMYDRYSLSKLLKEVGFSEIEVKDSFTSRIPNWNSYELESKNGIIFKPDSLFMEAIKSE